MSARIATLAVVAALAVFAGGCGKNDKTVEKVLAPGPLKPSDITTANAEACALERKTIDTAIDAYKNLEGQAPASMQVLVDSKYLDSLPKLYVLENGTVKPAPGSPCT